MQAMQSVITLALLYLFVVCANADDAANIVKRVAGGNKVRPQEVSPEDRLQVIAGIKEVVKTTHEFGARLYGMDLLVGLKDDDTIRSLVNQRHADPFKDEGYLRSAANAEIIPFVAPDLALPEGAGRQVSGDVMVLATRDWAADLILRSIMNSPEFPDATRAWVRGLDGKDDWEAAEKWWSHNKQAVLAKRYSEATWLPDRP